MQGKSTTTTGCAVILMLLWSSTLSGQPAGRAQSLFSNNKASVMQIRVMDTAANNKSSTGSGFLVDDNGLIATNYHVIASAIDAPEKYRIEVLRRDESVLVAEVKNVNIVSDLALLQIEPPGAAALILAKGASVKGDTVYSMGFPHDLGITLIPGTYNGLAPHSATQRIHFSGSLNAGMSGGPAFNDQGEVIGINVATAGNQMTFLVPVRDLRHLIAAETPETGVPYSELLAKQLQKNSKRMISQLLAGDWKTVPLGGAHALYEVTNFLRCWGNSKNMNDTTDERPFYATRNCQTDHNIYVKQGLSTGKIEMQFYWLESDTMNSLQFYDYYQRIFSRYKPGNVGPQQDLGNWSCEEGFVTTNNADHELTKSVFCARAYKKLKGIYDVLFLQGSVSRDQQAHMTHFTIAGTTHESALAFTERFMESGIW
jgi:serine protease Do